MFQLLTAKKSLAVLQRRFIFSKKDTDILELWHGPTSAFKDMALQILPHFLTRAVRKTGEQKKSVILVGDKRRYGKSGYGRIQ